ncbi:MAG: replication-associated recombination protein A [Solirubrobacteraceae bacterium]|nr:replication-associated recombination protein A [Solirubrobacteraceae bacterium]
MDSLFDADPQQGGTAAAPSGPLPARMRPATLDDVVGQEHVLGTPEEPTALRRAIAEGKPHSMILYGPPGSGKTTLARIVAASANAAFEELSAVEAGRPQVREVIERARHRLQANGTSTIFFLDEIHRFNKAQQDALLPAVEEGLLTLIGATTENPYFEVNSALLSRAQIYELQPLTEEDVLVLLRRAIERGETGDTQVADDALAFLAARSGGDARSALGALELACETSASVDLAAAEEALQRKAVRYDKGGDQHYDLISAFIKSVRASDPDAALYYLAVMLEGGEDPRFIVRRIVISASEDVGNADPRGIMVATAAAQAVEHVGMPECAHALAQATVYLALAPKSNSAYLALGAARQHVRQYGAAPPPSSLRDAHYPGAAELGRGSGYDYAHDHPQHLSPAEVRPDELADVRFWAPDDTEAAMRERWERITAGRQITPKPPWRGR